MEKNRIVLRGFTKNIKSGIFAIGVCVLMISLLMNLFFILCFDYRENFARLHTELNGEHVSFIGSGGDLTDFKERAEKILADNPDVSAFEIVTVYNEWCSCDYNGEKSETYYCFVPLSAALSRSIGKVEILSENADLCGVFLPYLFEVSGNYAIGDTFTVTNGKDSLQLPVAGFFSNVMSATPNCGYVTVLFSDSAAKDVQTYFQTEKLLFGIRLQDPAKNTTAEMALSNDLTAAVPGSRIEISNKYNTVFAGRFVVETVSMAIIGGLAVLLTVLTVFIIASQISSYITDNKAMFGILKTLGYSDGQIIRVVIPASAVSVLLVSLAGIALSYPVFPLYNDVLEAQTGLPYRLHFQPLPALLTVLLLSAGVAVALFLSLRKMTVITPLDAILAERRTAPTLFRKITVKDLPLPLHVAVSVQNSFGKIRQNFLTFVVLFAVSFLCVFGTSLLQNVIVNDRAIASFMLGEYADSSVTVLNRDCDAFRQKMAENPAVENCVGYYVTAAGSPENEYLSAIVVDDTARLSNDAYCYTGRLPTQVGEAAVAGKYARENGVAIGDTLDVTLSGKHTLLTVCGFLQSAKYLGCDVVLTKECYEETATLPVYSFYLFLTDTTDVETFNRELSAEFPILFSSDMRSNLKGLEITYFTGIKAICRMMILLSLFTVVLVLYVLVKNLLSHRKYDLGVLTALGYTPQSLLLQLSLTYLPAAVAATLLGTVSSAVAFNPLMSRMLRGIGIEKCNFTLPPTLIVVTGLGVLLFSFVLMVLFSLKIRTIKASALLKTE